MIYSLEFSKTFEFAGPLENTEELLLSFKSLYAFSALYDPGPTNGVPLSLFPANLASLAREPFKLVVLVSPLLNRLLP